MTSVPVTVRPQLATCGIRLLSVPLGRLVLLVLAALTITTTLPASAQHQTPSSGATISTVAGCCEPTGVAGYNGDGGPATSADLYFPHGVAVDSKSNFYIADTRNCLVRKVTSPAGIISTVAGLVAGGAAGNCGYSGDGGPATSAELGFAFSTANGVGVDSSANLYIADGANNVVREVTASTGIITTVAGCCESTGGNQGYAGDGGAATASGVELNDPNGVAVDSSGNIYIADRGNDVIRIVSAATGVISTVAGCCEPTGMAGYSGDGGPATSAELTTPTGVAVDSTGNFYIADFGNSVIRKVTISTGIITTVAGNGTEGYTGDGGQATSAELHNPTGIALDSGGNLYIVDSANNVVRKVTVATGIITTLAGDGSAGYSGDGGPATAAEMNAPFGLALDSAGNVYVADYANTVIREVMVPSTNATTTTVTSSVNPSNLGESVTFTATVSGGTSPTGIISFTADGSTITGCGSVTLTSSQAQCTTSSLPAGSNAIVAAYSGDSNNGSSSGTLTQVVNGVPASTTTLVSSMNPSTSGTNVTFTATISPAGPPAPTGTVTFTSSGAAITGCPAVTLSGLTATCTASLPVGTDPVLATYSGDSNYAGSSGTVTQLVNPVPTPVQFVPVMPCRVVDTRGPDGTFGGPALAGGVARPFTIPSGPCPGIPIAAAYSLNVTVIPGGVDLGYLTIWPNGEGIPTVSTLNSHDGRTKANAAIVPADGTGTVQVYATATTNLLLDINGYFTTSGSSSLEFYPLTPCRVADTRATSGYAAGLGSPMLAANSPRNFAILSASGNAVPCTIPSDAQAYSLNFTVVPPATGDPVGYLTVWPEGETQPIVSSLNDPTGTNVANAAIVPAGSSGDISVFANDATNLLIDINGYFAPAATGGYNLYTLTPCRTLDTRSSSGAFDGQLTVDVAASTCMPPATAAAYVFNATVIPTTTLGYLTLWPDGETQPVVSTLNAADGAVTSNMAIVPNSTTSPGSIDAFSSASTQLLLDISAYFAP
jgi:sugar lactone lactonase YvrE